MRDRPIEDTTDVGTGGNPNLRSVDELIGYVIDTSDGNIGHVDDFVVDDRTWTLRYMVVDTGSWLAGRKTLVASEWVTGFDWARSTATVDLTKAAVEQSPEYRDDAPVTREYEERLHAHYQRAAYWDASPQ